MYLYEMCMKNTLKAAYAKLKAYLFCLRSSADGLSYPGYLRNSEVELSLVSTASVIGTLKYLVITW